MRLSLMFPAVLVLAACEPTVLIERDETVQIPAGARWAWSAPDGDGLTREQGDVVPTARDASAIAQAISEELTAHGFRQTTADSADFFVHFHLGRRSVTDTLPPLAGRSPTAIDRDPGMWSGTGTPEQMNSRTVTWQEGMLVVDALTAADGKLAWRGIIVGEISPDVEQAPTAAIRAAVGRLIARFP